MLHDIINTLKIDQVIDPAVIDAAAEDDAVYMCTYKGTSRYVRPVINVTGTHSNGTPIGIVAIRHGAGNLPVSN